MKLYVASSWRNENQPYIVEWLRQELHEVYDFRNPTDGDHGFHWSSIDPDWEGWSVESYQLGLDHQLAEDGFNKDWDAMHWADACVLLLPCGRSAHLEAGYFVGLGKPLFILLDKIEPELMYKMASGIFHWRDQFEDLIADLADIQRIVGVNNGI